MQNLARLHPGRSATVIWTLLVALTLITWRIGETGQAGAAAMGVLLLIALVKGQMVAHYFMGLRGTRLFWRALMLGYFCLVGGLIAFAYFLAA
jgi:cytochrome c oxidase subunit IV